LRIRYYTIEEFNILYECRFAYLCLIKFKFYEHQTLDTDSVFHSHKLIIMRYALFIFIMASMTIIACGEKPKDGLGYDIQGEWKMLTFQYNGEEVLFLPDDVFKMNFKHYNGEEGDTQWWYYSTGIGGTDTSFGRYRIDAEEKVLTLMWTEQGSVFTGHPEMTYFIELKNDTLKLNSQFPSHTTRYVEAVRQ